MTALFFSSLIFSKKFSRMKFLYNFWRQKLFYNEKKANYGMKCMTACMYYKITACICVHMQIKVGIKYTGSSHPQCSSLVVVKQV